MVLQWGNWAVLSYLTARKGRERATVRAVGVEGATDGRLRASTGEAAAIESAIATAPIGACE
jgi:hypothetical protein